MEAIEAAVVTTVEGVTTLEGGQALEAAISRGKAVTTLRHPANSKATLLSNSHQEEHPRREQIGRLLSVLRSYSHRSFRTGLVTLRRLLPFPNSWPN